MCLLVYGHPSIIMGHGGSLSRDSGIPKEDMEVYSSLGSLCSRLRRPGRIIEAALLICLTRNCLLQINSIAHLFSDIPLVLVLPDLDEDSLTLGHHLFPRYLTRLSDGMGEVGPILRKIMDGKGRVDSRQQRGREKANQPGNGALGKPVVNLKGEKP